MPFNTFFLSQKILWFLEEKLENVENLKKKKNCPNYQRQPQTTIYSMQNPTFSYVLYLKHKHPHTHAHAHTYTHRICGNEKVVLHFISLRSTGFSLWQCHETITWYIYYIMCIKITLSICKMTKLQVGLILMPSVKIISPNPRSKSYVHNHV